MSDGAVHLVTVLPIAKRDAAIREGRVAFHRDCRVVEQVLADDTDWVGVAAGSRHTCALSREGVVRCFGESMSGQTGRRSGADLAGTTVFTAANAIVAGAAFSCAHTPVGWSCWGDNRHGQLGRGVFGDQFCPPANERYTCSASKSGVIVETPACWGTIDRFRGVARRLADMNLTKVDVGARHACGVALQGSLFCWGSNDTNQLGADARAGRRLAGYVDAFFRLPRRRARGATGSIRLGRCARSTTGRARARRRVSRAACSTGVAGSALA